MDLAAIFQAEKQVRVFRVVMFVITLALAIYSFVAYADDTRVSARIYSKLQSNHYCNRRLDGSNQYGCTSKLGGNTGIVWVVNDESGLDHILKAGPTPPYIAVLGWNQFSRKNILDFKSNPDRVSGVVFINDSLPLIPFSPDSSCPNRHSGLYSNDSEFGDCKQNTWQESQVSGLMEEDIPFPIFFINQPSSIAEIHACFAKNHIDSIQAPHPLCGMQLDSFMMAAGDSENCLNSESSVDSLLQNNAERCSNVEGGNIFAYFKPEIGITHSETKGKTKYQVHDTVDASSVVMVIAKLSSISMFTDISPGADSTISSIVTLMAAAQALGQYKGEDEVKNSKKNLAFALFDSEPFDYLGSTIVTRAMEFNRFPMDPAKDDSAEGYQAIKNVNIQSFDYVINLDQLANYGRASEIYLHLDPRSKDQRKIDKLKDVLSRSSLKNGIDMKIEDKLPLPPTSVHQFIKSAQKFPAEGLLGSVISNYDSKFANQYYHSVYDDIHNLNFTHSRENLVEHLYKVSSLLASALYELAFSSSKEIETDKNLVRDLLQCYLENANCSQFTIALPAGNTLPNGPIKTFRNPTKRSSDMNSIVALNLLTYFLGDKLHNYSLNNCTDEDKASNIYSYRYVNGKDKPAEDGQSGLCIRSQVLLTLENSPAYLRVDDVITVNKSYPAWTVSFDSIRNPVRVFMIPSPVYQWCVLFLGIIVTSISFVVVHHVQVTMSQLGIPSDPQPGTST